MIDIVFGITMTVFSSTFGTIKITKLCEAASLNVCFRVNFCLCLCKTVLCTAHDHMKVL